MQFPLVIIKTKIASVNPPYSHHPLNSGLKIRRSLFNFEGVILRRVVNDFGLKNKHIEAQPKKRNAYKNKTCNGVYYNKKYI